MKFPLLNIDGTKANSIEISDKLVKLKINHKLIKFVIDWQLNHAKPRKAKTKQRNQIQGSTKKIVAQKGSGGARHASRKAPIFVGGGVAHGPKGAVYKVKKLNKKVRKLALAQSLSKKNLDKNLYILADVNKKIDKTKQFNTFLESFGIKLNSAGGKIKRSADGKLLQSSSVAKTIQAKFPLANGTKQYHAIAGSYVEFAERIDGRDGFEVGNADKIFESTFNEQIDKGK